MGNNGSIKAAIEGRVSATDYEMWRIARTHDIARCKACWDAVAMRASERRFAAASNQSLSAGESANVNSWLRSWSLG